MSQIFKRTFFPPKSAIFSQPLTPQQPVSFTKNDISIHKMDLLPTEILELISLYYPNLCHSMILVFHLTRLSSNQIFLKSHFTKCSDTDGKITYTLPNGLVHRENDQPAIIYRDGAEEW